MKKYYLLNAKKCVLRTFVNILCKLRKEMRWVFFNKCTFDRNTNVQFTVEKLGRNKPAKLFRRGIIDVNEGRASGVSLQHSSIISYLKKQYIRVFPILVLDLARLDE